MLTMWRYVQTAAWPQPEPQPEPQPDRSSLYINDGVVTQTAAVRTAAVCLGHKGHGSDCVMHCNLYHVYCRTLQTFHRLRDDSEEQIRNLNQITRALFVAGEGLETLKSR